MQKANSVVKAGLKAELERRRAAGEAGLRIDWDRLTIVSTLAGSGVPAEDPLIAASRARVAALYRARFQTAFPHPPPVLPHQLRTPPPAVPRLPLPAPPGPPQPRPLPPTLPGSPNLRPPILRPPLAAGAAQALSADVPGQLVKLRGIRPPLGTPDSVLHAEIQQIRSGLVPFIECGLKGACLGPRGRLGDSGQAILATRFSPDSVFAVKRVGPAELHLKASPPPSFLPSWPTHYIASIHRSRTPSRANLAT